MDAATAIRELTRIFKSKDWFGKDDEDFVFDRFYELLVVLQPKERELMIELTDRYIWISGKEYDSEIKEVLNLVPSSVLVDINKLYLFPVINPYDEGKTKSGTSLVYDVRSVLNRLTKYLTITPILLNTFNDFKIAPGDKHEELLCLVDDFIGSGDTLFECIGAIERQMKLDYKKFIIVTISCQKETYDKLIDQGIQIYCKYQIKKGISDFNYIPELDEKKMLMSDIEKNIPGAGLYSFGWQESEATITLKRTPDNTFPVFWKKIKRQGKLTGGPFLRD